MSQASTSSLSDVEMTQPVVTINPVPAKTKARQGKFWILTIPKDDWSPPTALANDSELSYIRGQLELGESGYEHWQVVAYFHRKCTLKHVK